MTTIRRYAAFTDHPDGGNPAGVWVGEQLPNPDDMQRIAADIGYSETVFAGDLGERAYKVQYFSPTIEVPFCGHATIALGVALGPAAEGGYSLETPAGLVELTVTDSPAGPLAAMTSVEPTHSPAHPTLVREVIRLLAWDLGDLDDWIQPAIANAGANHLVISVKERHTLQQLTYDFEALRELLTAHDLITLQLIWRQASHVFQARNPFPTGGIVEDPATGAAAAALGGYLRDVGFLTTPTELVIYQGVDMGRPSQIHVEIPTEGGIIVSGTAVEIEAH